MFSLYHGILRGGYLTKAAREFLIGAEALGAVGTSYPVTVLFVAIASGLSLGASLLCSQRYGAKWLTEVQQSITTALTTFMPLSVGFYQRYKRKREREISEA